MNAEAWTVLAVGIALGGLIITLGGLMWRMLRSLQHDMVLRFEQIDKRFEQVAECFREVRRQLAGLAEDHDGLARELSELRGESRGRLDEPARPASAPAPAG